MVRQVAIPSTLLSLEVVITGPPAAPSGSFVPDSQKSRLGSVGPKTEQ
jgi:hypothetical protein